MTNINKLKIKEAIKIANFKHRGNVLEISREVGHHEEFVRKMLYKIKKEEARDVSVLIANNLMQYLFGGHQQRIHYLAEMMVQLSAKESAVVSTCCNYPIFNEVDAVNNRTVVKCSKCSIICNTMTVTHQDIFKLKMKILKELRDEDEALVSFAERMGYSNKEPTPPPPVLKQNFLIVEGNNKFIAPDQEAMEKIKALPPAERDKLRKQLEERIIDISKQAQDSVPSQEESSK